MTQPIPSQRARSPMVGVFGAVLSLMAMGTSEEALAQSRPPEYAQCGVCHADKAAARPGIGPNLWGVGKRTAGTLPGFAYSPAMKSANFKWNRQKLIEFVMKPQVAVPKNRMPYAGKTDAKKAAVIADYVLSLK